MSNSPLLTSSNEVAKSEGVESLPKLEQLSSAEKDALLGALWAEVQQLRARIAVLEAKRTEPLTRLWPFRVTFFVTALEYMDVPAIARTLRIEQTSRDSLTTSNWSVFKGFSSPRKWPKSSLKDAHNSSLPPARAPKANRPAPKATGHRRQASVGRAGGGRPLHPEPDQAVVAKAKRCRQCGAAVRAVVNTGKRQGLSTYQAIQKALSPLSSFFAPG